MLYSDFISVQYFVAFNLLISVESFISIFLFNDTTIMITDISTTIENTKINEPKKFVAYFTAEDVEYYDIEIINDSEEARKEMDSIAERFKDVFNEKELQKGIIWTFVLWALFT